MIQNTDELLVRLKAICSRKTPPEMNGYISVLNNVLSVLENEPEEIREHVHSGEFAGKPGGIVSLNPDIPTIVVPDLTETETTRRASKTCAKDRSRSYASATVSMPRDGARRDGKKRSTSSRLSIGRISIWTRR
jgi:hypothetical protein